MIKNQRIMDITNGNEINCPDFETREEAEEWIEKEDKVGIYEIMDNY